MADDILSTIIGTPTGTTVVTVERGQVALFAGAVKDDSPVYRDPRAAAEVLAGRDDDAAYRALRARQWRGFYAHLLPFVCVGVFLG